MKERIYNLRIKLIFKGIILLNVWFYTALLHTMYMWEGSEGLAASIVAYTSLLVGTACLILGTVAVFYKKFKPQNA
jgi:hypothetical protein